MIRAPTSEALAEGAKRHAHRSLTKQSFSPALFVCADHSKRLLDATERGNSYHPNMYLAAGSSRNRLYGGVHQNCCAYNRLLILTTSVSSSTSGAVPRPPAEVRLSCESTIDLPQPLIKVRVEGQDACFLVDTGASDTVLNRSLLPRNETSNVRHGSEVAGKDFKLFTRRRVAVKLAGLTTTLPQVAYTDLDPGLLADHISGLLSPERLNISSSLLFDFRNHVL